MTEPLIIKSLTKTHSAESYAETIFDNLNLTMAKGEFVAILGASGSGKSTLLNILTGMDNATSGAAYIDGRDVTKMPQDEVVLFRRQKTGTVSRESNLIDSLSVRENIALPLILDGKTPVEISEIVDGMLDFLGIEDLASMEVDALSNEQKQRVSIARTLVVNPVICFADEPTGNLDSSATENIMEMLALINSDSEITILLVTHDAFVASYSKRVILMADGKITMELLREGSRVEFLKKILSAQFDEVAAQ